MKMILCRKKIKSNDYRKCWIL